MPSITARSLFVCSAALLVACSGSESAWAQWSSNPAANLAIRDAASDQNQAKVRPTSDGGCYIAWMDGLGTGWDMRLQKLDRAGNELWPHGGILVADLTLSSTNDYGLAVDSNNNAYLSFQDSRFGGAASPRATITKIEPSGNMPWGPTGVQVSVGGVNSPKCAALGNGEIVVAWTEGSNLRRQKLDTNGNIQWAAGGMTNAPPAGNSDLIADVQPGDFDRVIISWVRNPNRFLHAAKYGPAGNPPWNGGNPNGVVVFDASALQFGYFPTFVPDGNGGAVFAWYETGGPRNAYMQHIGNGGGEMHPHNGVVVSTLTGTRIRLTPSVAYNSSTNETFVFWTESSSPVQNMWGVYGQKFDNSGTRQWTNTGKEIVPLNALQNANVKCVLSGTGAMVFWSDQPGAALLKGARLDSASNYVWRGPGAGIITPCTTSSGKARLDVAATSCGEAVLAWSDARTDAGDIYAQNVRANGKFGNRKFGDVDENGVGDLDDLLFIISSWGPCGSPPCAADVFPPAGPTTCNNGDGQINIDDLLFAINNWG